MFVPLASPEAATASELRALRLSLNSPVVDLASLPVGPASAAIALHDALDGPRVTVALRSERGGELRLFAPEDPPGPGAGPEDLLDAALSFAERMGFLFDDDEVETRGEAGPREAAGIWLRFAGLAENVGSGAAPSAGSADPGLAIPLTKFRQRIGEAGAARAADARVLLLGRF